ncbi:MAG: 30S ribosomal protein S16 [Candidatus Desulforudis sp.]|nr:30S ribosomal protein S16 [Desulforudis sp.]
MAVKIRLKRMGAKRDPFYRIVVSDARTPRDGRFIEELGYYDPLTDPATISVDEAKVQAWMGRGARMTETVRSLFKKSGVLQRLRTNAVERG